MIKKVILIGGLATGGALLWSIMRRGTAFAGIPTDIYGNPEGTVYDEAGRARRPPPPTPDVEDEDRMTEAEWGAVARQQHQDDLSRPVDEGGLRHAPNGLLLDSRYVPAGRLLVPLTVYNWGLFVEQPSFPSPQWIDGRIYRITIEGEQMVVRCEGRLRSSGPGICLKIMSRPYLNRWPLHNRNQHATRRDPLDEGQIDSWPQYNGMRDPVYERLTRTALAPGGIIPGGRTVYVQEYRHNCYHDQYADCAGRCIWSPEIGVCRPRTAEEQEAYEAQQAQNEEANTEARGRESGAREEWSQRVFGIPYQLYQEFREKRADSPTENECAARRQAVRERTDFNQPSNLWDYAPTYAPGSVRAVDIPVDHDDTMESRRQRGAERYLRWDLITRREYQRDWYAISHGGIRAGYGDPLLAASGGFYGMADIWGETGRQRYEFDPAALEPASTPTQDTPARDSRIRRVTGIRGM